MALKVKAVERLLKFDKEKAGKYRYVMKDELANTAIQITCIDRNGKEVKRVTSTSGDVEDPENENSSTGSEQGGTGGNNNSGGSYDGVDGDM